MAREQLIIIIITIAAGLFSSAVVIAVSARPARPPPSGVPGSLNWDSGPWRRLDEDDDFVPSPDDWSTGFGQRLTVQRRLGATIPAQAEPQQVIEASTRLISVTRQLRPKAGAESTTATPSRPIEGSTARALVRTRLQSGTENRTRTAETPVSPPATVIKETAQSVEDSIAPPLTAEQLETAESATVRHIAFTSSSSTASTSTTTVTSTTQTTSTTTATTSSSTTTTTPATSDTRPLWRIRMEQNLNNRRQSSGVKLVNETSPEPPLPIVEEIIIHPINASLTVAVVTLEPSLSSSTSPSRPTQSSRMSSSSVVRLAPLTTTRILHPTSSPVATSRASEVMDEENDVKGVTTSSSTTTTSTTTTPSPPTTTKKTSPPTPAMHSLEDILQRLVPAREDTYGSNPFLAAGNAQLADRNVPSEESSNEIVSHNHSTGQVPSSHPSLSATAKPVNNSNANATSSANSNPTADQTETQATTSIYIVGVVAVVPLAGVALWVLRVQLHKRRERLNESETSSETGFRKSRLPPVALSPSKHARLFYGTNEKEDLVPSSTTNRSSPWEFNRSRLRLQTLIGEGNFGQVWKAEAEDICGCQGTLLVAVKTVKDGAALKEKQELLREMRIMQQLGPHPNVVALLGCCTEQEPFLLIMEYVMYGRLLTFLREHRTQQTYYNYSTDSEALTSRDLTTFAYCVAKGMEFIYNNGVVHRDLAARNVLVDHNKLCKVADFGLSRSVRDSAGEMYEQRVKGALPIRWMAPESLAQSVFTQKSDVWSFGVLVWEIVTLGSTPYPGMEAREVMRRVKEGHRLDRPSHCRPEFYRLMSRCWQTDPQRRPDFGELKAELARLLDDADGYIDLDNFQESIYVPLESPSDESEKV